MSRKIRSFIFVFLFMSGCASSRMSNHAIDALFRAGQYEEASTLLKKGLEEETEEGRDGLLYLLDLGITEHLSGHYEESIKALRRADELAEIKDYTSLSNEAATLLISDNSKPYKGEEFENVLINVYLALDYALLDKFDDALIECRRVNRKLYLMKSEGKRSYPLSAFATYFSGILYESKKEWNDAYISYKQTKELMPSYREVGNDLIRIARKLKMHDEVKRWEEEYASLYSSMDEEEDGFPVKRSKKSLKNKKNLEKYINEGEIIVVFQNGVSPKKVPNASFSSLPDFKKGFNPVTNAIVKISRTGFSLEKQTIVLQNIESDAILNLKEKWGGILLKKIVGIAAKESIGNILNAKSGGRNGGIGLGDLLKLGLYLSDQADLRSWSLLPKDLQITRFRVEPGTYEVEMIPIERPDSKAIKTVQVNSGKTVVVTTRFQ